MPERARLLCVAGLSCARRSSVYFPCWGDQEFASIGDLGLQYSRAAMSFFRRVGRCGLEPSGTPTPPRSQVWLASQDVMSWNSASPGIQSRPSRAGSGPRARAADLIVTSAGVSVGALDLVRDVVQSHGRLIFWRVNVRPGKPLAVGTYRGIPLIGLPGNPVSAFVGFELFVRPAIERLGGREVRRRRKLHARLSEPIRSDGRESYLRAIVEEAQGAHTVRLTGHQGSGNLLSLVQANALLVIPAGVKSLAAGDQVEAWLL